MTLIILKRAARAFAAAAIAGIATQLAAGVTIHTLEDLKKLGISLFTAGIVAGLMALDKLLRFNQPEITIDRLPDDQI
jgi:hypothetical protein